MGQGDKQPRFVLSTQDSARLAQILRTVPPQPWPGQRRRPKWSVGVLVAVLLVAGGLYLVAQIQPDLAGELGVDLAAFARVADERGRALAAGLASAAGAARDAATGWLAGLLNH